MGKQVTAEFKNGEVIVSVSGVKGKACTDLTAAFEAALGGETISKVETPEMQERPLQQEQGARQSL